jgi:peptide/nickel transport system permease protein
VTVEAALERVAVRNRPARRRFRRRYVVAAVLLAAWLVIGVLGPLLAPYPPDETSLTANSVPPFAPSPQHLFGTDQLGRDLLSRSLYGLRTSLMIALAIRLITMVIGIVVGLAAAEAPGFTGRVLIRTADVFLALPPLLVALTITAVLGPSLVTVTVAVVAIGWPDVARLTYAEARRLLATDYVEASRALGAGRLQIVGRHLLPALAPQLAVAFSVGFPGAIMYEAGLSFFGLGVQPPDASLGTLIASGRSFVTLAPWMLVIPVVVLAVVVVSLNIAGDLLVPPDPRRRLRLL